MDGARLDGVDGGAPVERRAGVALEQAGEAGDRAARIDAQVERPVHRAAERVRGDRREPRGGGGGQHPRAARRVGGRALEHGELVVLARDDQRPGGADRETGARAELEPALPRAQGAIEIGAVADPGHEHVAEVADARADGVPVALEQRDAQAATAPLVRVGEADDPGTDDAEVGVDDGALGAAGEAGHLVDTSVLRASMMLRSGDRRGRRVGGVASHL